MKSRWMRILAVALSLVLVATFVAACGGSTSGQGSSSSGEQPKSALKVAMVTDVGGLGDKSFNDGAAAGLEKAKTDLGVETKVLESKEPTDYESNINQLATAGFTPIFAVGFLMQDTVKKVASQYPDTILAGIDESFEPSAPPNVVGILFKEQEAGYLAGYLAGLATTDPSISPMINDKKLIGFVGGMEIPPVQRYQAGYIQGAKAANPAVEVKSIYTGSFTDQQKGQEAANALIEQGCDIIFAAAGQTGLGSLKACQQKKALFIGVDVDQFESVPGSGDVMLTSAMKNIEQAVFLVVKQASDGSLQGGKDITLGLKEDAVGLAPYHDFDSKIPQATKDKVDAAKKGIADGSITVSDQVPQ